MTSAPATAVQIEGAARDCSCDHCGRHLKVGIRTDLAGTVGADCLAAMLRPKSTFSGPYRPSANVLRDTAIIKETRNAAWMDRNGWAPSRFSFPLAGDA